MQVGDAVALLAPAGFDMKAPATWADLGCGTGLFTRALADLLAPGSTVHATDHDASALTRVPTARNQVRIRTHHADFVTESLPFGELDGVLMANSLHYVEEPVRLIERLATRLRPRHRFLIVEYDTDRPNRWVPYPISRQSLGVVFASAGYESVVTLGTRPSVYQRADLYAAHVTR
jgi:SAM-dependent methyltransferase